MKINTNYFHVSFGQNYKELLQRQPVALELQVAEHWAKQMEINQDTFWVAEKEKGIKALLKSPLDGANVFVTLQVLHKIYEPPGVKHIY